MILHCQRRAPATPSSEKPWLVMLHGLLGSGSDWQPLLPFLHDWPLLLVDLPGHGASGGQQVCNFDEMNQSLSLTLQAQDIAHYWLVGYSLGGRIAMHFGARESDASADAEMHRSLTALSRPPRGLRGILVEGGHPGLTDTALRQARCEHDRQWAQRFRSEPLSQVLEAWYCQEVFADLTAAQRSELVAQRCQNNGPAIAAMLEATSLGRQPWLLDALRQRQLPFGYLCGERDRKFQTIAVENAMPLWSIPQAGHNAHRVNPAHFVQQIRTIMALHDAERGQG